MCVCVWGGGEGGGEVGACYIGAIFPDMTIVRFCTAS